MTPLIWRGTLRALKTEAASPVLYSLVDGAVGRRPRAEDCGLNWLLDAPLSLRFTGKIHCVACGRRIKRTVGQGFCFPCFRSRPEADLCLFKPELCHFFDAANPCRDEAFGQRYCFTPHVLYASLTSGVKVGITRRENLPRRWIDQGAAAAMPLVELPSRKAIGELEHRLSSSGVNDRTHWMKMLRAEADPDRLDRKAAELLATLRDWQVEGILPAPRRRRQEFTYPVLRVPKKIKSLSLDTTPTLSGTFLGIKGQYLIFDIGVLNVRKFTGYEVEVTQPD